MNFFIKYKLHFNIVLLLFWGWVLYSRITAGNNNTFQLLLPVVFIGLSVFNIYKVLQDKQPKSDS